MEHLLKRIAQLKMLVIGDLMLDRYIFGDANRISPEAPVPVVDVEQEKETLGAAANVALNLRSIGVDVEVLGTFGFDIPGERLKHLLSAHSIKFISICQREDLRTILKTRVIVRNQQLCRLDIEDLPEKYNLEQIIFWKEWLGKFSQYNAVIFSDYAKGALTQLLVNEMIKEAQFYNVIVAADPKPKNGIRFLGIDLLKPNKAEALEMLGIKDCRHKFQAAEICRELFLKYCSKNLVITLGQEGMLIAENGEFLEQIPS
ncbi:MAG: PfkB family carbohydrate kinase, partial [Puniceicoccales bacterium]|nr:PfkB family carbohydrate kinase [Puniceicoccales bacterium]